MLTRKKDPSDFIESVVRKTSVLAASDREQGLEFLVRFFATVRPSRGRRNAAENLKRATASLEEHPVLLANLRHAVIAQLVNTDLVTALSQSGIPLAAGFWQEFFSRLRHKLLPSLQSENDFLYVLNRIFFRKTDYRWVEDIPFEEWARFFESLGLAIRIDDRRIIHQLTRAMMQLGFQVAQLGSEQVIVSFLPGEQSEDNPFLALHYLLYDFNRDLAAKDGDPVAWADRLNGLLARCREGVRHIREQHSMRGTSLHQTYVLAVLQNKLDRMEILADVLDSNQQFNTGKFVSFFKMLVRNVNRKNSLREFMSQCLGYLAYQIAEQKGAKGNKYITSTRREYRRMLLSAMSGGAIISFVSVFKNLITKIPLPDFWHGVAYSVNYSVGFITIEDTGSTLATKQPAFTASAVASSLDTKQNTHQPNLYNLALTVAKVSRSQIASFIGNLIVVFPGAYGLAWLYDLLFHRPILSAAQAMATLESQHPWHSLSLLYACNTGVFLFLSGLIAGYVQNQIRYGHVGQRLKSHPLLRMTSSAGRLERRARYLEHHGGALAGNLSLGFMLGMSSVVPHILGLPFDIRHITVSAGNSAIAAYSLGLRNIPPYYALTVFCGILGIGLLNFLVSFLAAFIMAVKSRGVRLKDYPEFLGILFRYFRNRPLDFIRPRRQAAESD